MSQTITALEVQKRDKERVSVYLDGEFAFGLPVIDAAQLRTGQTLSDDEIAALRDVDAVSRATDRAIRLLARRPYSIAEIRRHLESKEIASPIVDEALDRLARMGYVDDRAFATYWIENRERFKPRGARALRYELRQKGVANDIIAAALDDLDPAASAYQAAQERISRLRGQTQREVREGLGAFLLRRGFDYSIAREVCDRVIRELEDEHPEFFTRDDDALEEPYEE